VASGHLVVGGVVWDPADHALSELRRLVREQLAAGPCPTQFTARCARMAELFDRLDQWITGDGYRPAEWRLDAWDD
jgi:hypothetical protein